ncbi:general odorant-binding protein 99a [Eurosta solidaginis]|uniref:general odorant-binding protein 99a n=1 Tax=Eurosta solidaginis TaxID=178769 RepID=UPI0035307772
MKLYVAFLSLIAVVLAANAHHDHSTHDDYVIKTKEDLARYRDDCVSKLSIPADLVEKFKKWEYPDNEQSRCYLKCVFEHFGLFDEKDGFDVHKIHHQLAGDEVDHSDELHGQIEDCVKESADAADACTKVYRGAKCFFRHNLSLVKQSVASK